MTAILEGVPTLDGLYYETKGQFAFSQGLCTGSDWIDPILEHYGYPGEAVKPRDLYKDCIVYKTHSAVPKWVKEYTRALIIMRNPFDVIKTFMDFKFARIYPAKNDTFSKRILTNVTDTKNVTHKHPEIDRHVAHVDPSIFHSTRWYLHVTRAITNWRNDNMFWMSNFKKDNCLVVLYENLVEHLPSELSRISQFLGTNDNETSIRCTVVNREGHFHRKPLNTTQIDVGSLYTAAQTKRIHRAVMDVSEHANGLGIDLDISQYFRNISTTY